MGVKRRDEGNAVQWYGSSNHNFVIPILIFFLFIYLFIYFGVSVVPSILIPMALIVGVGYEMSQLTRKINKVRGNQLGGSIVAGPRTSTCRLCTHMTFPPFASSLLPSPFFLNLNF